MSGEGKQNEHKLTPEQIKNWRQILCRMVGEYAMIMPESAIQNLRNMLQARVDELPESKNKQHEKQHIDSDMHI